MPSSHTSAQDSKENRAMQCNLDLLLHEERLGQDPPQMVCNLSPLFAGDASCTDCNGSLHHTSNSVKTAPEKSSHITTDLN